MNHPKSAKLEHREPSEPIKFAILSIYGFSLIGLGFWFNSPSEILEGLFQIIVSPDTLISDYMGVGNIGSAFVNAGLLNLIVLFFFYRLKLPIYGVSIACLFTVTGVGLFGKNLFNVWLIVIGVFLYAKYQQEPFSKYAYKAFYGTALAPMATEILFSTNSPLWLKIFLAVFISLLVGFILSPVADNVFRIHQGFSLYNIGFTAGMIGVILVALLASYGIIPIPQMIWTQNNPNIFIGYLILMFISMILVAFFLDKKSWQGFKQILTYSGKVPTDFVELVGFCPTLINMGMNG
jgi:hypothetical protein